MHTWTYFNTEWTGLLDNVRNFNHSGSKRQIIPPKQVGRVLRNTLYIYIYIYIYIYTSRVLSNNSLGGSKSLQWGCNCEIIQSYYFLLLHFSNIISKPNYQYLCKDDSPEIITAASLPSSCFGYFLDITYKMVSKFFASLLNLDRTRWHWKW